MSIEHIYTCDGCREHRSSDEGDIGVEWMTIEIRDLNGSLIRKHEVCSPPCAARVLARLVKQWKGNAP